VVGTEEAWESLTTKLGRQRRKQGDDRPLVGARGAILVRAVPSASARPTRQGGACRRNEATCRGNTPPPDGVVAGPAGHLDLPFAEAHQAYRDALVVIGDVAVGLADEEFRRSFLDSTVVQNVRRLAGLPGRVQEAAYRPNAT